MSRRIAIIGGGNLGASIADGLIQSEFSRPVELTITRRNLASLSRFAERGCMVHSDNKKAVRESEVIILAVKPYNYVEIIKDLKAVFNPKKHVVVSVITGAWIEQLQQAIGKPVPVIRAMPNTAIAIQQSMTCLAHSGASPSQLNYIQQLFDQLGKTVMIDEKLMDAATISAAELLGEKDKLGSIEAGKLADIIAVDGDPLKDARVFEKVVFVMKDGVVYKQ